MVLGFLNTRFAQADFSLLLAYVLMLKRKHASGNRNLGESFTLWILDHKFLKYTVPKVILFPVPLHTQTLKC